MLKIYLYRRIGFEKAKYPNPYLPNLERSLSRNFSIVNKDDNKIGALEPFKYLFKADIFYFNWIENITRNRLGKLQAMVFILFLLIVRSFGKKIVWTLHNKYAHDQEKNYWTDLMYRMLVRYSNLILTHSQAGVDFINAEYPRYASKTRYIIHPVPELFKVDPTIDKKYDLLVWGIIQPYKGIAEFMQFVQGNSRMQSMRILIAGKCADSNYKKKMNSHASANVIHLDELYTLEEIAEFASRSKFILFPYQTKSILSSGSLMDSIAMQTPVIGPNDGAFKDLAAYGLVKTYDRLNELADVCDNYKTNPQQFSDYIKEFCANNTWDKFAERISKELSGGI